MPAISEPRTRGPGRRSCGHVAVLRLSLTALECTVLGCVASPVSTGTDAGPRVTFGAPDGGGLDAGTRPAGMDAGVDDAGLDAGGDAGSVSPTADAGLPDGGPDSGSDDAGPAAMTDSGPWPDTDAGGDGGSDAGPAPDAGPPYDPTGPLPAAHPIGVDLPDLLWAYLGQAPTDVAGAQAEMDAAVANGFTQARFVASPFWPNGMTTGNGWVANPTAFFAAFDALVRDAHRRGLRLTPSLLWNISLFPDVAGEPIGSLFTPGTRTRMLAESYISQVVGRYANDTAVLFWELGNEINLGADIDVSQCTVCNGASSNCGSLAPSEGTPCQRTAADDYYSCNSCRGVSTSQQDLGQFTQAIGQLILSVDPSRSISTGNAYPRSSAWHLSYSPCPTCDWTADTQAQYLEALSNLTPSTVGILSVHHYPGPDCERFGDDDPAGLALLATTENDARQLGKQLYVGEYGEPSGGTFSCGTTTACGGDPNRSASEAVLDGLVRQDVVLSSLWAFDFDQFCAGVPTCYTVEDTETDFVSSMSAHNAAYGTCTGRPDGENCPIGQCSSEVCLPVPVASLTLSTSAALSPWIQWTNCSNCTPSTFTLDAAGYADLTTSDLPCTGTCMYAGGYALSPSFPVLPGHLLVRVDASASAAGPDFNVILSDASHNEVTGAVTAVSSTGFQVTTAWIPVPTGVANVSVRLENQTPDTTLEVRSVSIQWQP